MKKIILIVASLLSAMRSFAHKENVTGDSPLMLSPSMDVHNHGSHYSHYSMSITVEKDSVCNVSQEERKSIVHALATMHNCADAEINIIALYISTNNYIIKRERNGSSIVIYEPASIYKPSNEKCLYAKFQYKRTLLNRSEYKSIEYIIPLSDSESNYYRIEKDPYYYDVGRKEKWMNDFIKNHN